MAVEVNPLVLLVSFALALVAPTLTVYLLLAYRIESGLQEVEEDLDERTRRLQEEVEEVVGKLVEADVRGAVDEAVRDPAGALEPPDSSREEGSDGPAPADPTPRYLVVDDSPVAVHTIQAFLKRQGVDPERILTAANAAKALELFREHRPPVAILDLELPDLDGHDIARQIRALEPETRILVVSSLGDEDPRVETVVEIGAERVRKPVTQTDLEDLGRDPGPADGPPTPPGGPPEG